MEKSSCIYCMSLTAEDICPQCGKKRSAYTVAPHHLIPGTVLNSRYEIGAVLGEGGFGITYIGKDTMLNLRVAVKEYYPNGFVNRNSTASSELTANIGDAQTVFERGKKRFLEEARILAKFSDEPSIVSVRDFFSENNTVYIVMEYLEGIDLKEYFKQHGKLSFAETFDMLSPIMTALSKVHGQYLIHRDISPSNIMVLKNSTVKLLDFGAARDVSGADGKSQSIMLKPGYAPKEQYISAGSLGTWTDIYSLCATIYKCITGKTPPESIERTAKDELVPPSELGVAIDPSAEAALMKGLSVSLEDRFNSMDQLIDGLSGRNQRDAEELIAYLQSDDAERTAYIQSDTTVTDECTAYEASSPEADAPIKKSADNIAAKPDTSSKNSKFRNSIFSILFFMASLVAALFALGTDNSGGSLNLGLIISMAMQFSGILFAFRGKYESHKSFGGQALAFLGLLLNGAAVPFSLLLLLQGADIGSGGVGAIILYLLILIVLPVVLLCLFFTPKLFQRVARPVCGHWGASVTSAVVAAVALSAIVSLSFSVRNISVAGEMIPNDTAMLSLAHKEFNEDDIKALCVLGKLNVLNFSNCSFSEDALVEMDKLSPTIGYIGFEKCSGLNSYSFITNLPYLRGLMIWSCGLTNAQLAEIDFNALGDLEYVFLCGNEELSDISPVISARGGDLTQLNISNTSVNDISQLKVCKRLQEFYANGNGLDAISSLTSELLTTLELNDNNISDISILSSKHDLKNLKISGNQISDILPLQGLTSLTELDIRNNMIESLLPLSKNQALTELYADGNLLENLNGLETAIYLSQLSAANNRLTSLGGLENCTVLKSVNVNNNQLEDISVLGKSAETLQSLYFCNNHVSDISFLERAANLRALWFDNNSVSDISALEHTSGLTHISASNNRITSIEALRFHKKLMAAFLSDNLILDMSPLQNMGAEKNDAMELLEALGQGCKIDVSNNQISALAVTAYTNLQYLSVFGNPMNDFEDMQNAKYGSLSVFCFSFMSDADYTPIINSRFAQIYLVDCPLDQQAAIERNFKDGGNSLRVISAADLKDASSYDPPEKIFISEESEESKIGITWPTK